MKLTLAIASLITLALLIFAALQENYWTGWRLTQGEYKKILFEKARDESEQDLAHSYSVELRQIVVPGLDGGLTADRCVSCHVGVDDPRMTDVPKPFLFHPGNFLENHDVNKFGCTGCHGGQGRATTKNEAHADQGEVYWERPLLSGSLVQSSCGICHDPGDLKNRGAPVLALGAELFRVKGCMACHKLGERGGTLGPPLERIGGKGRHELPFTHVTGERTIANWHREHLRDPQKVVPGSKMPKIALKDNESEALTTYLLSLRSVDLTERMIPRDKYEERYRVWHPLPLPGAELYQQFCLGCHGEGLETVVHETLVKMIPAIRNPDYLAVVSEDLLFQTLHDGRAGTEMQAWGQPGGGLADDEIRRIVQYLLAERREKKTVRFEPTTPPDLENGKRLFEGNCTSCHGLSAGDGTAPWLGSPGFQETYPDPLVFHTIKNGRANTMMNPYGKAQGGELTDQEIADLVGFLRTLK